MGYSLALSNPFSYRKQLSLLDRLSSKIQNTTEAVSRTWHSLEDRVQDAHDKARRTSSGSVLLDGVRATGYVVKDYGASAAKWTGHKLGIAAKYTGAVVSTFFPISWGAMPAPVQKAYARALRLHPHVPFWTSILTGDIEALTAVAGVHLFDVPVSPWAAAVGGLYFTGMLINNGVRLVNYFRTGEPQASWYSPIYGSINAGWRGAKYLIGKHYKVVEDAYRYAKWTAVDIGRAVKYSTLNNIENVQREIRQVKSFNDDLLRRKTLTFDLSYGLA